MLAARTPHEIHAAQTVVPIDARRAKLIPERHLMSYGLGWFLDDYHGKQMIEHGGSIDAMITQVGMMPKLGLGLVVLSNREGNRLPPALMDDV